MAAFNLGYAWIESAHPNPESLRLISGYSFDE